MKNFGIIWDLEFKTSSETARGWDNWGLLGGDPQWSTRGAVISVDLTERAIEVAAAKKVGLIVNHHPCIFPKSRGLSKVTAGNRSSGLVLKAIQKKIAVD